MKFLQNNFLSLIIILIVGLLFIERCNQKPSTPLEPVIVRDTIWVPLNGSGTSVPQLVNSIPYPVDRLTKEIQYLPDTNYQKLVEQYRELLLLFLAKNVQKDSLKIDSIGYVSITDTVTKNLISGRKYTYDLKYPVITNTVTLPPLRVNQIYIGGALESNQGNLINQLNVGFLLKNKRDQIYGIYGGIDKDLKISIGLQSYWKINLRRK